MGGGAELGRCRSSVVHERLLEQGSRQDQCTYRVSRLSGHARGRWSGEWAPQEL